MRFAIMLSFVLMCASLQAEPKIPKVKRIDSGKVVSVTDGDTVRILINKEQIRVRLEGIDAPEAKQAFGQRAKEHLIDLVAGRTVDVHVTGLDRYGRTLGKLYLNGLDINQKMLSDGFAWHFEYYNSEPHYAEAQRQAQQNKRGLFVDSDPIPPWEFRKK